MSSFKRKIAQPTQKLPDGTKVSPAQATSILTSSGIPSFDDILGGGIQLGTDVVILNSDPHSSHSNLLQKYYIAQGIASGHEVHVIEPNSRKLVESCMWSSSALVGNMSNADEDVDSTSVEEKVKIAWRYERMQKFKTTVSSASQGDYCQPFDLTCQIPTAIIDASLAAGRLHLGERLFDTEETVYDSALRYIEGVLERPERSTLQKVVRFSIPSFAGPFWGEVQCDVVIGFLLRLRQLLRESPLACCLITLPSYLSSNAQLSDWIERLGWCADACLSLKSFTSDPSMASLFPSHHGLLEIHSLPRVQSLVPASDRFSTLRGLSTSSSVTSGGVGENNLAYKCTRKRLVFETFHLDAEGGVGERRTTPAVSASQFTENNPSHTHPLSIEANNPGESSAAMIPITVEDLTTRGLATSARGGTLDDADKKQKTNKPKKRVGFQVDRPDLFDF